MSTEARKLFDLKDNKKNNTLFIANLSAYPNHGTMQAGIFVLTILRYLTK